MKNIKLSPGLLAICTLLLICNIIVAQEKISGIDLIEKVLNEKNINEAYIKFNSIKNDTANYSFTDNDFINLSYTLLEQSKPFEASKVLEMGKELFPSSANIYLFLATSYYKNNEPEKALKAVKNRFDIISGFTLTRFNSQNKDSILDNADDIISNYIKATGGEKKWRSIETMKVTFQIFPNNGEAVEMVRLYKRPNLYSQGVKGSNRFNSTNNSKTWNFNGEEWKESNTKYRSSSIDNYTIDYKEQGISYEFAGLEVLNYNPVYHIIRTFPDGFKQDLYFSAESFLLQEIKSDYIEQYPFMESYFSLWDYRDIEGVKIPYIFIRNVGPLGPPHGGVITDIQVNIPLSDTLFLPPEYR